MSIEAMKLALEALEYLRKKIDQGWDAGEQLNKREAAITDLRQAIEQAEQAHNGLFFGTERPTFTAGGQPLAEQAQPVAWIEHEWSGAGSRHLHFEKRESTVRDEVVNPVWTPLYTAPPPRQPLPPEQIEELMDTYDVASIDYARAIEAAHGIKENP